MTDLQLAMTADRPRHRVEDIEEISMPPATPARAPSASRFPMFLFLPRFQSPTPARAVRWTHDERCLDGDPLTQIVPSPLEVNPNDDLVWFMINCLCTIAFWGGIAFAVVAGNYMMLVFSGITAIISWFTAIFSPIVKYLAVADFDSSTEELLEAEAAAVPQMFFHVVCGHHVLDDDSCKKHGIHDPSWETTIRQSEPFHFRKCADFSCMIGKTNSTVHRLRVHRVIMFRDIETASAANEQLNDLAQQLFLKDEVTECSMQCKESANLLMVKAMDTSCKCFIGSVWYWSFVVLMLSPIYRAYFFFKTGAVDMFVIKMISR